MNQKVANNRTYFDALCDALVRNLVNTVMRIREEIVGLTATGYGVDSVASVMG